MNTLQTLTDKALREHTAPELALGFLRYEALRALTTYEHAKLRERNFKGERFDDMIDELVFKKANP